MSRAPCSPGDRDDLPSADQLTAQARDLLAGWGLPPDRTAVRAEWNPRLRTSAGRAFWRHGRIELNPRLLAPHRDRIAEVLAHEAAHVAAFRLHGPRIRPHGREWALLMGEAGHEARACHRLLTAGLFRRRFWYLRLCDRCGARAIARSVRYTPCGQCGSRRRFLVLRAPAGAAGRSALHSLSLSEARRRCIMAGPS